MLEHASARPARARRSAERGAAALPLILVFALCLLGLSMSLHLRVAKGADQADGLQAAADSAALAGAESIRDLTWGELVSSARSGKPLRSDLGEAQASNVAGRNGANIESYTYDPMSDRIRVTVRSRAILESGQTETASAIAQTGKRIATCLPQVGFSVKSLNGIDWDVPFMCGELDLTFHVNAATGVFTQTITKKELTDRFRPRLVDNRPVTPILEQRPPGKFVPPSLGGLPADRKSMIERGRFWTDMRLGYSMEKYYPDPNGKLYRTDCSGFVSMAWGLNDSLSTVTLPSVSHPISKDELLPGDILLHGGPGSEGANGHVVMFGGWTDASRTHYFALEENGSLGAIERVIPYPYWPGYGTYVPYRYNNVKP